MAAEDTGFKVEKLNGENYHSWKFQMKMYLIGKDLWELVTGEETLNAAANPEQQRRFRKRENVALATVCLSVETSLQIYVRSAKNAKEAWDNLEQHFERKSLSQKIFYRRKLYSARMGKGAKMIDHINYIKTLAEHLEAVDDEIAEKDLVIILISSLPEEYNYLITALETIAEEKLSWNYVRDRLIHEYDKMLGGSEGTVSTPKAEACQDALFTKKLTVHKKISNCKNFQCHYCKKPGHFARDCFKKKADAKNNPKNVTASMAERKQENGNEETATEIALAVGNTPSDKDDWWIDSGATQHMTPVKKGMYGYAPFKKPIEVKLADDTVIFAYGKGELQLVLYDGKDKVNATLKDVLYVPKIQKNLLSLTSITDKDAEVQFKGQHCKIIINGNVYSIGHKHGKLYKLNVDPEQSCCFGSTVANDDNALWHYRYGHLGYDNLKLLHNKSMVDGLSWKPNEQTDRKCEGCAYGKQSRQPFSKNCSQKNTQPLELIHSDVCGPMNVTSVGGSRYFVTFIDDCTHYTTVYMLKKKSEVLDKFKEFVESSERLIGKQVKKLRSDNGGEYISEEFAEYCKSRGILHEVTVPYTPQQNGVAERMNRTIIDTVRSMLHHGNLPLSFWAEAVSTANYIRNRSPTSCLKEKTPHECWYDEKPDVSHFKVFGCNAFVHVPDQKRSKLDKKSMHCIFVGYPFGCKGYKLYNPETKQMIRSRDVIFLENSFEHKLFDNEKGLTELLSTDKKDLSSDALHFKAVQDANKNEDNEELAENQEEENAVPGELHQRPQRNRVVPERLGSITGEWWNYATLAVSDTDEPTKVHEDNQGTIALSRNPKSHPCAKHIDIKFHYVREVIEKKKMDLVYCPTEEMIADIMTKGLPKPRFEELRSQIGVKLLD